MTAERMQEINKRVRECSTVGERTLAVVCEAATSKTQIIDKNVKEDETKGMWLFPSFYVITYVCGCVWECLCVCLFYCAFVCLCMC